MIKTSPYTEVFYNEYQINPGRSDYNITFGQLITRQLDVDRLRNALARLVEEHIILNSHLCQQGEELYWTKNTEIFPLQCFDFTGHQAEFVKEPFDLQLGPLYRFGLFSIDENRYELILVLHHALIDGRKYDQFLGLVGNYYNDEDFTTGSLDEQFKEIVSTNSDLHNKLAFLQENNAESFWQQILNDIPAKNTLPFISAEPTHSVGAGDIAEIRFEIDLKRFPRLLCRPYSLFNVLLLNWGVVIARYSGSKQAQISYPIAIKEGYKFEFGAQINTLVLLISFAENETFHDLHQNLKVLLQKCQLDKDHKYTYLPTASIVSALEIKQLNAAFSQTHLKNTKLEFIGCEASTNNQYNIDIGGAEILFSYQNIGEDKISCAILYNASQLLRTTIDDIHKSFLHLLLEFECQDDIPIGSLEILSSCQQQGLLNEYNNSTVIYRQTKSLTQLFEQQVLRTPNAIALIYCEKSLSYQELNKSANQVAHKLRQAHFQLFNNPLSADTLIALYFDRSLECVIAMLAVLKAGGAYVPLAPAHPAARLQHILQGHTSKNCVDTSCSQR